MRNDTGRLLLLAFVILSLGVFGTYQNAEAQAADLQGPILLGEPVGGGRLVFQDIGSGRVWQQTMPDSSFSPYLWSPDGCYLLLRSSDQWHFLSIRDSSLRSIPRSSPVGRPGVSVGEIWTLDSRSITFTTSPKENVYQIYSLNMVSLSAESLFSLEEWGRAVRWLSDHELLYETRTDLRVWDTQTKKSRTYREIVAAPKSLDSFLYFMERSPNWDMLATFFSLGAYENAVSGKIVDITPENRAKIQAMPKVPGFDIYFLELGAKKHIEVNAQFLQSLEWSPSSQQIVVATDAEKASTEYNGIYVYNVQSGELRRVSNLSAMYSLEYGIYTPSWSPDSEWLALYTPNGWILYRLTDQQTIKLDGRFNGFHMRLLWSPVMKYGKSDCPR